MSPTAAPRDAITPTKSGEYKLPPAITVRKAGPERKRDALEIRFTKNNPINPREDASLKKSLNMKNETDRTTDNAKINIA